MYITKKQRNGAQSNNLVVRAEYQNRRECEKETGLVFNSLTGLYVHLVFGKNETISANNK